MSRCLRAALLALLVVGCELPDPDRGGEAQGPADWSARATIVASPYALPNGRSRIESYCAADFQPQLLDVRDGPLAGQRLPAVPAGVDLASTEGRTALVRGRYHLERRPFGCNGPGEMWRCMDGTVYCQWVEVTAIE
ncbi:MAG: hypothetical protein KC619_36110 [Myxococcales bacterium]|nr:hypothetical protein [Myxococcales bacterium]